MRKWKLDREQLTPAYDILCQGAHPWEEGGTLPFSLAWCVVGAGATARAHRHQEYEVFLILQGRGRLRVDQEVVDVAPGDAFLMAPFEVHELTNGSSEEELRFLDLCWERPGEAHERNLASADGEKRHHPRRALVTATPPTPNGDLHVGHLSGPYLGADIYCRYLRSRGGEAIYISGADDHQSYVEARARAEEITARQVADRFGQAIPLTLAAAGVRLDHFALPKLSPHHAGRVQEVFRTLHDRGAVVARQVPTLYCDTCRRFLFEAHVLGTCPVCGMGSAGNACEACGWPNDSPELIDPRCRYCGGQPSERELRRLFFPLAPYAEALRAYWAETPMSTHLRCLCEDMLSRGLPDIAVSHPADWGIPVPVAGFEDQRIYVWFEMAPGYLAATREVEERLGSRAEQTPWHDPSWDVVQFFGFDNGYFHAVLFPAIFLAYDPAIQLPSAFVTNEFYRYEGTKFSTSRNHALWGPELLAKVPTDVARFYLAWDGPEREQTDFRLEELEAFTRRELVGVWEVWLRDLGARLESHFGGVVPATGAWSSDHQRFFLAFADWTRAAAEAYEAETFSPRRAARVLMDLVATARRFGKAEEPLAGLPGRYEEWRTAVALETSAARLLAVLASPLMPGFAQELWSALGEEPGSLGASWPEVPMLIPAGSRISRLDRAWFRDPSAVVPSGSPAYA